MTGRDGIHGTAYAQSFSFDVLGNMTQKSSGGTAYPQQVLGDDLNYGLSHGEGLFYCKW